MFDHEWFTGRSYKEQRDEALWRCALRRFPKLKRDTAQEDPEFREFWDTLRTRTLVYLRDGFSYEIKEVADVASRGHLTFECEPVDDHYKVGSFVVSVPFDDVVRVEVFAVPRDEMPEDMPAITGFRSKTEPPTPPS
ncbi:MAG: hypothetical protein V3W34_13900 [Phycisphaerae bacterium]